VEANLKARLGTALIALPLLLLLVGRGSARWFAALLFLLTLAALREYFLMVFPGRRREQSIGILFGVLVSLALFVPDRFEAAAAVSFALVLCFSLSMCTIGSLEEKFIRLGWTLVGGLYLGFLLPHWVVLFRLPEGRAWVLFVLLVIMSGDSFAYFAGRRFGGKKLAPAISPGKTVAGAWGYMVGGVLAAVLLAALLLPRLSRLEAAGLSLCLSALGQIGDLFESWIKRVFAVKDSGHLLPGHGGLLDRLDSLIFPAVFTVVYLKVFHS